MPLNGIAVVGLAGKFPGSRDCDEFWQNLRAGREGLTFFTDEEIENAGIDVGSQRGKRVRSRGVVEDADMFDAAFFGYTPREAEIMDPQQRVFLEVAWAALESAGFDPDRVPGAVGVYAGAGINTYYPYNLMTRPDILGPFGVFPAVALNEKDFVSTRVAYKLNLRGPAISVQTACSTSLVAVCNACQSLLSYECDVALAGGVAVNFPQCHSYIHEEGGMISEDGHCKPFDKGASGTLFSDGAGAVVLRRLQDAVESGDNILAVIKGYALNNDGSDKAGFTAPSIGGQCEVIEMAQAFADFEPDTISYIEAHGTATPLGDPIEIAGLTQAFRSRTDARQFCAIGSVKSNVGHLDVAAGIAGLIKTVLALHYREIPPTIHFEEPNPKIDFGSTPFYVADTLREWTPPDGVPRRAGVSSFGIGGTNAHVVLEEAPELPSSETSRPYQLLPIAARTREAVEAMTANLGGHLGQHPELSLADVAYTLQAGRYQFNLRRVVVCSDRDDAIAKLGGSEADELPVLAPGRHNPPLVFMFPGQGAQRVNMGRELYDNEPLYRQVVDECAEVLEPDLGMDLRDVLFPETGKREWAEAQIVQTGITQPALFVTEYALARLWMSWGIQPDWMIGHSVGEYVAACLAEVFSLEDGLKLIAARGRLIQEQPAGTMLAVMAGEDDVRPLLVDGVSIATINAPTTCVVSGSDQDIENMAAVLADAGLESRPLHTSHAFHSVMMEPVVEPFTEVLKGVSLAAPQIPFMSNLTADWIEDGAATDPSYWAQHLRQAVRFSQGAAKLLDNAEHQILLEVGPGTTLTSLTRMNPAKKPSHVSVPSLASAMPGEQSEYAVLQLALGRLWQAGVEVDWSGYHANEIRRRVPLPTYPFEHKRYFVEPGYLEFSSPPAKIAAEAGAETAALAARTVAAPRTEEGTVKQLRLSLQALSGLSDEELGQNASLLELGFDSLLLSRACSAIDTEFGVSISHREIAEHYPSIAKLAAFIDAERAGAGDSASSTTESSPARTGADSDSDLSLPVTDLQREIWVASLMDDDASRTYNEARLVHVKGRIDASALRESLQRIVDRHDALRAIFDAEGVTQTIPRHVKVDLPVESVSGGQSPDEVERNLGEQLRASITQVFDLEAGPLFRFVLYELGEEEWALLLVVHHVVADGWSLAVMLDELGEIYTELAAGHEPPEHPQLKYSDYISWLNAPARVDGAKADEDYWLKLLADKPTQVELPSDRPRPAQKTYLSNTVVHSLDPELVDRIKAAAKKLDCTLFHLLTASFYAWLHRVTGQSNVVVAIPMAGQIASGVMELKHAEQLVAHCVNMLPIRLDCNGDESFTEFLIRVKSGLLAARDHQHISFQNLVNKLGWPRDTSRIPLASVSLNFANDHQAHFGGFDSETLLPPKHNNFFDLTADVIRGSDDLVIDCKFNADLFDASTVERWLNGWEKLLDAAVASPDTLLADLDLLEDSERERLLEQWNSTARDYPAQCCLHQLLERQAERVPGKAAATCEGRVLTYEDMDKRANRFAQLLRNQGIGRNDRVGICVERSTDMLAAAIGIMKAGAAYLPLDPSFPSERLRFMAEDAGLSQIISSSELVGHFEIPRDLQILVDHDAKLIESQTGDAPSPDPERDARPEDPVYVIYTSGSTGTPKGVIVPHRAVVNFLHSMAHRPGLDEEDVLVAVTTLSFDISGLELYLPLTLGASVVIAGKDEAVDGQALIRLLDDNAATVMQATPVTWRLLLDADWTPRSGFKALVGGEPLPKDLADKLIAKGVQLWNMYGPTETTIWSTCDRVEDTSTGISIGTPIDNTSIYILDERKHLCPIGVPGELYIGGDGVTLGYWQRPELTGERFIEDPFRKTVSGKIYATGDKARWLGDGRLEHLGRLDSQVKVRGYRVELGEIEARIAEYRDISEAAVRLWSLSEDDVRIVACFVPAKGRRPALAGLRKHLRANLPEYMIPQYFLPIEEIPLTPNGKVDRRQLPTPAVEETSIGVQEPPSNAAEIAVAEIWTRLIQPTRPIGRNDMFFEIGGHSLLALRAQNQMEQQFGASLDFRTLFRGSLKEIAALLQENRTSRLNLERSLLQRARQT